MEKLWDETLEFVSSGKKYQVRAQQQLRGQQTPSENRVLRLGSLDVFFPCGNPVSSPLHLLLIFSCAAAAGRLWAALFEPANHSAGSAGGGASASPEVHFTETA